MLKGQGAQGSSGGAGMQGGGQGRPAEAETKGRTSFEQGSLALSMFPKSGQAGDSWEAGGAHRTHLRALGAVGVHGGVIVDISNTGNIVT